MRLTQFTAVASLRGVAFETVARSPEAGVELDWCSVFGMLYRAYYSAQVGHWNTRGRNFAQDHKHFGDMYAKLAETIDTVAEHIRVFDIELPEQLSQISTEPATSQLADDVKYLVGFVTKLAVILPKLADIDSAANSTGDLASTNLAQSLVGDIKHLIWLTASLLPEDLRASTLAALRIQRVAGPTVG